jgi:hypothetical protein
LKNKAKKEKMFDRLSYLLCLIGFFLLRKAEIRFLAKFFEINMLIRNNQSYPYIWKKNRETFLNAQWLDN